GGATILCLDDIAVTTYSDYALAAFAVHIEEWRAGGIDRGGGFIKVLVAVVIIIVVVIVVRLFFGVIVLFVSCTSERVGILLRPGLASVFSRQHDGIVPNRPAMAGISKAYCGEQGIGRRLRRLPGLALVIGKKNIATIADGDHAYACARDIQVVQRTGQWCTELHRLRVRSHAGSHHCRTD